MGPNLGTLLEIEVTVNPPLLERGEVRVTGIVEEEEMGGMAGRRVRCKSMIRNSVDNALTALRRFLDVDPRMYDIHINFPGAVPTDGPSAGVAIALGIYSALTDKKVDHRVALTGEISLLGEVKPVGGVVAKVEAARRAGAERVLIPYENWQELFREASLEVIPVKRLEEVIRLALFPIKQSEKEKVSA
jgi:Lon-like ATP-dependent protease